MQGGCSFALIVQIDVHHLYRMHHKAQGANLFTQVKKKTKQKETKTKTNYPLCTQGGKYIENI